MSNANTFYVIKYALLWNKNTTEAFIHNYKGMNENKTILLINLT